MTRMRRLVIVPMLNKENNGTLQIMPQESLFASEPSTCSPYFIKNFDVQIGGISLSNKNIEFKYENFLHELNGKYATNSNMEEITSGQISMDDYNSNYGYICVDLSRRYDFEEKTALSIQIRGSIESPKDLDFLCYITYTREFSIDLNTGQKLP